jgi:hypothetical protein
MSNENIPEKNRRLTERVVLTLFGYGQNRREEYLLLKLFQVSSNSGSIQTLTSIFFAARRPRRDNNGTYDFGHCTWPSYVH